MKLTLFVGVLCFATMTSSINPEETSEFWNKLSADELDEVLRTEENNNVAKNVIIFLGDGMGVSTVTAGRILKGQLQGQSGEEAVLEFDKFPNSALIKTYCVDRQVADSASTATAFLSGVKTNYYVIGLNARVRKDDCVSSLPEDRVVQSVFVDAFNSGKSSGLVSTTRINHATPAAAYAHTVDRMWYSDAQLPPQAAQQGCKDIAKQFVEQSELFTVVLGGGRKYFLPNTTFDLEYPEMRNGRLDGEDLVEKWKVKHGKDGKKAEFVWNKEQFDRIDVHKTDSLLGMFEPADMKFEAHRINESGAKEPSLAEMTSLAIQMLEKNEKGYLLLVEGGRIDHAHHAGNAHLSLHDTVAFDEAVSRAMQMTSQKDTMIIVTADHSHPFTIGGYPYRGNPILGKVQPGDEAADGKAFTTLLYGNGPGSLGALGADGECEDRQNISGVNTEAIDYLQQSAVPLTSSSHGGEDVALYAVGPMSHLFRGVKDQTYIARVIRYASCIGDDVSTRCSEGPGVPVEPDTEFLGMSLTGNSAQVALYVLFALLLSLSLFSLLVTALFWRHLKSTNTLVTSHEEHRRLNDKL